MDEALDDAARIFQKVKAELGLTFGDDEFLKRFKDLDKGLVHEDEFLYLLKWSGRCKHFNKLDQSVILPSSKEHYRVPDALVVLEVDGVERTVLLEIKTTAKKERLKWVSKFYQGLKNYAALLNLPLLIAWKWSVFDIWTLFDISHFEQHSQSYVISLQKAHQENLMGQLLGDFVVELNQDIKLTFKNKKVELIEKQGNVSTWQTVIEDVYLSIGSIRKEFNSGVFSLLMTLEVDDEVVETDNHLMYSFSPSHTRSSFAQSIPIRLASDGPDGKVNWINRIRSENEHAGQKGLEEFFQKGLEHGTVRYVLRQQPRTPFSFD